LILFFRKRLWPAYFDEIAWSRAEFTSPSRLPRTGDFACDQSHQERKKG
jgi:hypothetical protein